MVICINKLSLGSPRRKFGRICQRFWLASCCGSRHLQSAQTIPVMPYAFRVGILCRQKKEHDV
jgi:hypothetical protein